MMRYMRVAVISDIHANLPALEAVLEHIDTQDVQEVWCLGDLLGYGPSPNEVISYASDWNIVLSGNHDRGVAGALRLSSMRLHTPKAIELMQWTAAQLTPSSSKMLQHIVSTPGILSPVENISLAHGSPLEGEASVLERLSAQPPPFREGSSGSVLILIRRWMWSCSALISSSVVSKSAQTRRMLFSSSARTRGVITARRYFGVKTKCACRA
jgi:hypothetical protein